MVVKEELGNTSKENKKLIEENIYLKEQCGYLQEEDIGLRKVQEWFESLVRVFGRSNVNRAIEKMQKG